MEYKIIKSYSAQLLETEVNRLIKEGWKIHGGMAIETDSIRTSFYQTMNKGIYRDELKRVE